jgi:DNA-binding LytR/AlgR family response regulator
MTMAKFIKATRNDGVECLINMDHIICCQSKAEGVEITTITGAEAIFNTSLNQIQGQLEDKNIRRIGEAALTFNIFIEECRSKVATILSKATR